MHLPSTIMADIYGTNYNDNSTYNGYPDYLYRSSLYGTDLADNIYGYDGDDSIYGGEGADYIEVSGSINQYSLSYGNYGSGSSDYNDTAIWYGNDLIGIVQDSTNVSIARDFISALGTV